MKFVNNTGKDAKIKVKDKSERLGFRWITAKVGDEVDLPKEAGMNENFTIVAGKGIIETVSDALKGDKNKGKGTDDSLVVVNEFEAKLNAIKGIGSRVVLDILSKYPTEADLRKAIADDEHLPFRNDRSEKLKEVFGDTEEKSDE